MKKGTITEKSHLTRSKILQAALDLFRENGFVNTTMRNIAEKGEVALGSAYYYFKTKDDIVLAYYAETQQEANEHNEKIVTESKDFKKRFNALLTFKFVQMKDDRQLVGVLAKSAADPDNQLSPFSPDTKDIRLAAIKLIEDVMSGSNIQVAKEIKPHLARALWLYQMGLIFYWIHDKSPDQKKTFQFKDLSLDILIKLMQLSSLPLMSPINRPVIELLKNFEQCTD